MLDRYKTWTFGAALLLLGASPHDAPAIPAATRIFFHLTSAVSSMHSQSGQPFGFVLTSPVRVAGVTLAAKDSHGTGTLLLAGHAGSGGHEGDLTLELNTLAARSRRYVFVHQRIEINGKNAKIASAALGFVPIVGVAAHFIRGHEIEITPDQVISTVLVHPAVAQ